MTFAVAGRTMGLMRRLSTIVAAILTVWTGWDYLRVGLKHMDS